VEVYLNVFLTSATDGGVRFTFRPLYLQGKNPDTHRIGGSVGPGDVLDGVAKI
jgi:hypothetical protein